jgi:transposase
MDGHAFVDIRAMPNGIIYVRSTSCQWRRMPRDMPFSEPHDYLQRCGYDSTLVKIPTRSISNVANRQIARQVPLPLIADSKSARNAEKGRLASIRKPTTRQESAVRSGMDRATPRG